MKSEKSNIIISLLAGILIGFLFNGIITLSILDNRVDNLQVPLNDVELWIEDINAELSVVEERVEMLQNNLINLDMFSDDLVQTIRKEVNDWSRLEDGK